MTRSSGTWQLTRTLLQSAAKSPLSRPQCAKTPCSRPFTSSSSHRDEQGGRKSIASMLKSNSYTGLTTTPRPKDQDMAALARAIDMSAVQNNVGRAFGRSNLNQRNIEVTSILGDPETDDLESDDPAKEDDFSKWPEPFHFHVYSHRHNTHVTVTRPNRNPIISLSAGNLGFKHASRGAYDSAYQLGAYTIDKLQQAGWHMKIHKMEVVLRGFGPGREAVTKVLLSNEGKLLREKIVKVSDSTRLKFGGARSKKPKRR